MLDEESFYKQKSRIQWIKEGDMNTKFFHNMVAAKQKTNYISTLIDSQGNRLNSYSQISNEAVSFFQRLLGTPDVNVTGCPHALLSDLLPKTLTDEAQLELVRPIIPEEVRATIFAIGGEKAPGPDGFTAHFFKVAWNIIEKEVVEAVLFFFRNGELSSAFNSTIVALIPKCKNPNNMKNFRPISCCTVIYKCITKIMANRIKKFLPCIIEKNQSAFIGGRSITDNILMAEELVRGYSRTSLSPRCALKIDLQKAFDSLSWEFIFDVLTALKVPGVFIGWIRKCLTTPWFSISVNGGLAGYFRGAKGIRQGDPLSPYIFVIAMNVLSNF